MLKTWQAKRERWLIPLGVALAAGFVMIAAGQRVVLPIGPGRGADAVDSAFKADAPSLAITRIAWLGAENEARERLRLLDPSPLFMPGNWSANKVAPKALEDRPGGEVTELFSADLKYPEARPTREIFASRPIGTPEAAAALVAAPRWFRGMGRGGDVESTVESPGGVLGRTDVYVVGNASPIAAFTFPLDQLPDAVPWRPVELMILLNAAGQVVAPMVITSSGVEEVDEKARELLRSEWVSRLSLRPGHYRFVVGP